MIQVTNLTPAIGSRVEGTPGDILNPETAAELRKLLVERGVLVFPELNLTDEQQVELAGLMGTVRDEGKKGIFKVTLDEEANARAEYLKGSWLWHMDGTHDDIPVFGSLLTGRVLSKEGGQTGFANSYAAYEALSPEMKARLEGLKVVHSFKTSMERAGVTPTDANVAYWNGVADKTHSLVWTHKCGRKSLVVGCHASHVVGMDRAESDALLAELLDWVTQPQFLYWHGWTPGDMLIWDNTGVLHRATPYPLDSGRMMHRTTLVGEEAFA
ncbi:TauD/TfdA dioxygenase family protein [Novosphingobium album (ex Hu et al. 2023)]|uniref:TauD/TfdA family dioxygenase n=1 Tax=Novosphingobium album (ex Hu et al. 2023) TaxID=2930093 RepID=A0ABT0AWK2_9SPHN|nr:TauD/TfdA family dioxygenase [Novosphingobium album (ex Hu et al. 2023)]MCJ2177156.1 TauD/TfdA family dioxygenase [Novosphingobium album (ex Hu et al. 2023)]